MWTRTLRGLKVLGAVILFSFGNYALGVLWPPILSGLSGQGVKWPPEIWGLLISAVLAYGGLASIAAMWLDEKGQGTTPPSA